jgi:hypothetical protein
LDGQLPAESHLPAADLVSVQPAEEARPQQRDVHRPLADRSLDVAHSQRADLDFSQRHRRGADEASRRAVNLCENQLVATKVQTLGVDSRQDDAARSRVDEEADRLGVNLRSNEIMAPRIRFQGERPLSEGSVGSSATADTCAISADKSSRLPSAITAISPASARLMACRIAQIIGAPARYRRPNSFSMSLRLNSI